jgi:nicotinamidase-related amidase
MGESAAEFLGWLEGWRDGLEDGSLVGVVSEAGGPERVAVLVVDLIAGFCSHGPLASPRVGALAAPAAAFLQACAARGIQTVVAGTDAHPPDSQEFAAFPPHCIAGTPEAESIPELTRLPLWGSVVNVPKGSLNVGLEPAFADWQAAHPEITAWIVVGDCTDLCVYQAAMHLRMQANTQGLKRQVWVPAELVDTYDLPVEKAQSIGALPHDGDFLHGVFLYHLALNGVRVVRTLRP